MYINPDSLRRLAPNPHADGTRKSAGDAANAAADRTPREKPPKKRRRRKPSRDRLGPEQVETLVGALLTRPRAARAAVGVLQPAYFSREPHLRLVWQCPLEAYRSHPPGAVPYEVLLLAIAARAPASAAPARDLAFLLACPEYVGRRLMGRYRRFIIRRPGVLHRAYSRFRRPGPASRSGLRLLERFLHERGVVETMERLTAVSAHVILGDADSRLRELESLNFRIKRLGTPLSQGFDSFPDNL